MSKPILVVEDNPDNMYVLDHLLTRKGYRVVQAINGDDALRQMVTLDPVLVLLDMQMPGVDGYTTVQTLRQDPRWQALPVVAVTASSMPGDRERVLAAGCTDYISKPINPRELLALIEQYLEGAAGGHNPDR